MLIERTSENAEPRSARAHLPSAYGAPESGTRLPWTDVRERLERARHYWLCTVGPADMPQARPLDGVWIANALYFGGHPDTRWRRNLAANANASVHLSGVDAPVMLEGAVVVDGAAPDLASVIAQTTLAKYGWGSADQYRAEVCAFIPQRAIAWNGLFEKATRFTFR